MKQVRKRNIITSLFTVTGVLLSSLNLLPSTNNGYLLMGSTKAEAATFTKGFDPQEKKSEVLSTKSDTVKVVNANDWWKNGKCNAGIVDISFYAPANINISEIIITRPGLPHLTIEVPPVDNWKGRANTIKVADYKRMFSSSYEPTWDDIKKTTHYTVTDNADPSKKTVQYAIHQDLTIEKGQYVTIENALSYCSAYPPGTTQPLSIKLVGKVQAGGFCEDRARYSQPAIFAGGSGERKLSRPSIGSLKEIAAKYTTKTRVPLLYYSPIDATDERYLGFVANENYPQNRILARLESYKDSHGDPVDASKVVSKEGPRTLSAEEKRNGVSTYVTAAIPDAQSRDRSQLFRQIPGQSSFNTIGKETGWVVNALAYNPEDNWLYGISQGRVGNHSSPYSEPAGYQGKFYTITKDDPCFPAGHLLQIHPVTGEVKNLGRVTAPGTNNYAFQGKENTTTPNDLWGGINVGTFTKNGQYVVSNASTSGTGALYSVNINNVTAQPINNAQKWINTSKRLTSDWWPDSFLRGPDYGRNKDRSGRAWSEDYTPLYVPEQANNGFTKKQHIAGDYIWGIQNGWNSDVAKDVKKVFIERINTLDGTVHRWDISGLRTRAGQSIPSGHQWGKAWAAGNSILGFGTASSGATADQIQIQITNPESNNPAFSLVSRDSLAPKSYNSNGTSSISVDENVVDLEIRKTRKDISETEVIWDIEVKNVSKDTTSSGFIAYDTIPKDFVVTELQSNNSSTPIPAGTTNKSFSVGNWSAYVGTPIANGNTVVEAIHGQLEPGNSAILTIKATRKNNSLPTDCVENVAGVIGFDRDPNTKHVTVDNSGLDEFGNKTNGEYGDVDRYRKDKDGKLREYGDITSDNYCKASITVEKRIVEPGQEKTEHDQRTFPADANTAGWEFTTNSGEQKVLLDGLEGKTFTDANLQERTPQSQSVLKTSNGTESDKKGTAKWLVKSSADVKDVSLTESQQEGFSLVKQTDIKNAKCTYTTGIGTTPKNLEFTNVESPSNPGVKFNIPFNKRKGADITCVFDNAKLENKGKVTVKKAEYDPKMDKPTVLENLGGAEFSVYAANTDKSSPDYTKVLHSIKYEENQEDHGLSFEVKPGQTYFLVETKAPTGLSLLPQPLKLETYLDNDAVKVRTDNTLSGTVQGQDNSITITVNDVKTGNLPRSGGPGISLFGILALGLFGVTTTLIRRQHNV
ncbi:hypothetical protein JTE88_00605 [Arcanobacterium phocisimile]|uniref:DUF6923 domain-containing protein n=1 Tax=Arcanobacterium phocisimile TaxID=1302235 RepID=A0ABX7IGP3_9ACTO|nr:SpaA isopeptide-forming pilin-related protein [Arcanobacterium phocisimile]QRV02298.1 hypothetical protein JTE88_00605 [Arcanobacterium phocisimile]